jgi:hypothetical protein
MVSQEEARAIVQKWLDRQPAHLQPLVMGNVTEYAWGWMFNYGPEQKTGEPPGVLYGGLPLFVTRAEGVVEMSGGTSALPPIKHLRRFEWKLRWRSVRRMLGMATPVRDFR